MRISPVDSHICVPSSQVISFLEGLGEMKPYWSMYVTESELCCFKSPGWSLPLCLPAVDG